MKKTIFMLSAVALLAFTSCKDDKKNTAKEETKTEEAKTAEEPKKEESTASSDVPSFDNAEVKSYLETYESYVKDYKAALESKDMTKFQALSSKGQELATKGQEAMKNLSTDDAKKLSDYLVKRGKELQEYTTKMMQ